MGDIRPDEVTLPCIADIRNPRSERPQSALLAGCCIGEAQCYTGQHAVGEVRTADLPRARSKRGLIAQFSVGRRTRWGQPSPLDR